MKRGALALSACGSPSDDIVKMTAPSPHSGGLLRLGEHQCRSTHRHDSFLYSSSSQQEPLLRCPKGSQRQAKNTEVASHDVANSV